MFPPDVFIMNWMVDHRVAWATHLAYAVMRARGNTIVLGGLAVSALSYVVVRRQWVQALSVVSAGALAVVITTVLKALIGRPRPAGTFTLVQAAGYSMPSTDGALTVAVAASFFLLTAWRTARARLIFGSALTALVIAVGLCLVYLGAHWPSDVLAGWVIGWAIAGGVRAAATRIHAMRV